MTQLYTKQGLRYVPTTLSEQGAWGWRDLMALCAFRYCLGRMTYISGVCADWLVAKWADIPPHAQALIRKELDETFRRDDEDRATNEPFKALGWDCDRDAWEKVRSLWAAEQQPARPVELTPAEIAHRAKLLAAEMDAVGEAMARAADSTDESLLREAGWNLQDAAASLLQVIKDKT
ncbi:hypothetical protein [Acidovorax sp. RAC01]|uniref:hypothetical protein n=1 Tax=Acidovorax sp. RAC01 TaxID=1842533 RepID=UPI00083E733C|nr:hypothetical protein [Acidovorax sp. RAC01]AOG23427.1 hypothetical protein BSY15_3785 [Acidovorax sp. RAC01]AOG23846.1 hypothetical protein BSY15_3862 [Acidovorax sp. RAC01]